MRWGKAGSLAEKCCHWEWQAPGLVFIGEQSVLEDWLSTCGKRRYLGSVLVHPFIFRISCLLGLLFQAHEGAQELVLVRERSGSGPGAAGSVMAERLDGCLGLSAADSVWSFSIWRLWEKSGNPPPRPTCVWWFLALCAKTDWVLQEGKAGSGILHIRPMRWEETSWRTGWKCRLW